MNAFQDIRRRLGISQAEMAEALGVTQGNVSFYERGKQNVPPPVALKLIDFARTKGHAITFDDVYATVVGAPPQEPARAAA